MNELSPEFKAGLRIDILATFEQIKGLRGMPLKGFIGLKVALEARNADYQGLPYEAIETEVARLESKGQVEEVPKEQCGAHRRWRITDKGRELLEMEGMA